MPYAEKVIKTKATLLAERKRVQEAFLNQDYYEPLSDYYARKFVKMFDDDFETDFTKMTDKEIMSIICQYIKD